MRRGRTFKPGGARTILLTGVLACLCFSSGEGLRLMPIPSPAHSETGTPNFTAAATSLRISLSYQYATCGLEKCGQKRVQRQQMRDGLSVSSSNSEPLAVPVRLAANLATASYRSPSPVPRPPGRAPPLLVTI
jgi:hypothetical protein